MTGSLNVHLSLSLSLSLSLYIYIYIDQRVIIDSSIKHFTSHTVQPIVTYDLYQWSTTTVSCTPDDGCKWHPNM
jgi:hypothetical protein